MSCLSSLQGPELRIMEPNVNFGLVRVGTSEQKEMTIFNTSQIPVNFTIIDLPEAESDDAMVCISV